MKKYTAEQLNNMKVEQVRKVAKNEFKLALSEKGKRFTKGQLITKIIAMTASEEIKQEEKKDVKVPVKLGLNVNNTHTIVSQARKFLGNAIDSYNYTSDKKRLNASLRHVEESIQSLRMQVVKGKAKGLKRTQINNAINLMNIMIQSYKKKVSVQN